MLKKLVFVLLVGLIFFQGTALADFNYPKLKVLLSDYYGLSVTEYEETKKAFIEDDEFSINERSFSFKGESDGYYSYLYNDWLVLNYDSQATPYRRLIINVSSKEPQNISSLSFSFNGNVYTFSDFFDPSAHITQRDNGEYTQKIPLIFGNESKRFLDDIRDYIFALDEVTYDTVMKLTPIKMIMHGKEEIEITLPNTFIWESAVTDLPFLQEQVYDEILNMSKYPTTFNFVSEQNSQSYGKLILGENREFPISNNGSYTYNTPLSDFTGYETTDTDEIERLAQSVLMLEVYDRKDNLIATGSGFVAVESSFLFTNYHVIEDAYKVVAISDDNQRYVIEGICALDKERDLALLKIEKRANIPPLKFATNYTPKRAETVVAIGSPIGFKNTVSIGNISAVYQMDDISYIHFTAPISQGSSGGALFNSDGNVIGITSASYLDAQNINVAINSFEIVDFLRKWNGETLTFNEYYEKSTYNIIYFDDHMRIKIPQDNFYIEVPYEWEVIGSGTSDTGEKWIALEDTIDKQFTFYIECEGNFIELCPSHATTLTLGDYKYKHVKTDKGSYWISSESDIMFVLWLGSDSTVDIQGATAKKYIDKCADIIVSLYQYLPGQIAAGEYHTVGLKADGTVVAVGDNTYGQCDVSDWTDIVAIAAGNLHTVGLKADGTVVATGEFYKNGKCDVSGWTDIVAVAAGFSHTVGLKADGTVVAVGITVSGECDVSDWTDIVAIDAYNFHTVGLKADGTVVAVGYNPHGQCDVSDWTDIVAIAAGNLHTVGLKADGTVVAVGSNTLGQCDVSDWTDIVDVVAKSMGSMGLKADGTVVVTYKYDDASDWTDIVAIAAKYYHTIGLKADGTVVAVGDNDHGECNVSGWDLWD